MLGGLTVCQCMACQCVGIEIIQTSSTELEFLVSAFRTIQAAQRVTPNPLNRAACKRLCECSHRVPCDLLAISVLRV